MSQIIDDEIISRVLFNCDELFDFEEFDLSNTDFVEALGKIENLAVCAGYADIHRKNSCFKGMSFYFISLCGKRFL